LWWRTFGKIDFCIGFGGIWVLFEKFGAIDVCLSLMFSLVQYFWHEEWIYCICKKNCNGFCDSKITFKFHFLEDWLMCMYFVIVHCVTFFVELKTRHIFFHEYVHYKLLLWNSKRHYLIIRQTKCKEDCDHFCQTGTSLKMLFCNESAWWIPCCSQLPFHGLSLLHLLVLRSMVSRAPQFQTSCKEKVKVLMVPGFGAPQMTLFTMLSNR